MEMVKIATWSEVPNREPVGVTFHNVHLGRSLVLFAGLDYNHERDGKGPPVTLRALVDGQEIGRMVHRDGDGMKRIEIPTHLKGRAVGNHHGDLRIEVTSPKAYHRSLCWAGAIHDATRREAP